VRPRAKVIESLQEVVHEKSIGTKMNDLDLCLEVVSRSRQPLRILTLNISETVRDRGLVSKDYQLKIAYGLSNGHVTVGHVTSRGQTRDPNTLRAQYLENYLS